jgi:hypothetical protein
MIVAIADYKTVFSEYHNGSTSFIHLLSKLIATSRDAAINQDDTDKYPNQEISYIFKRLSQYPGLSILSKSEKPTLHIIHHTIDSVITFR